MADLDLDALLRDAEQYARVTDQTPASFIPQLVAALRWAAGERDRLRFVEQDKARYLERYQELSTLRKQVSQMAAREAALHLAILSALNELGVLHPGYPAPISNAAAILRAAVTETAT